jgi:cytochrome oxidase assembly protein ShyY1
VLRFLVTPRALALHALMVVCTVVCILLAQWQWDRAQSLSVDPSTLPTVAFEELSVPAPEISAAALGRSVTVRGTYLESGGYLVTGRTFEGQPAVWELQVLRLDDGSKVPVIRGVREGGVREPIVPPRGEVEVLGRIQPSQDLTRVPPNAQNDPDAGLLSGVATSELFGLVGAPLHPGWIAVESEQPAPAEPLTPVPAAELAQTDDGLKLQNVLYAVQWTVFGAFVLLVYRRFLRDAWSDYQGEVARRRGSSQIEETV